MSLLLQVPAVADTLAQSIVDTAAQAAQAVAAPMAQAAPAAEPVVKDLSVWNLTMAGGWLMIPLALLAVVSIYIFFERLFAVNRASKEDAAFMEKIKNFIHRTYALKGKDTGRSGLPGCLQFNDFFIALVLGTGNRFDIHE